MFYPVQVRLACSTDPVQFQCSFRAVSGFFGILLGCSLWDIWAVAIWLVDAWLRDQSRDEIFITWLSHSQPPPPPPPPPSAQIDDTFIYLAVRKPTANGLICINLHTFAYVVDASYGLRRNGLRNPVGHASFTGLVAAWPQTHYVVTRNDGNSGRNAGIPELTPAPSLVNASHLFSASFSSGAGIQMLKKKKCASDGF